MTKTLEEAMVAAKPAFEATRNAKEQSLVVAREMIGKLQDAVIVALDGATLQGLPNLGTARDTYHAVNVRGGDPARKFWRGSDKPTLVISRTGELQVVTFGHDEIIYDDVDLEKMSPGDLPAVAERYKLALRLHLERCGKAKDRSDTVIALAQALGEALDRAQGGAGTR